MNDIKFWKYIENKLMENHSIILLIVVNSSKSSPGRAGFKMAISDDKTIMGTIGGGIMEFDIINEVNKLLDKNELVGFFRKLVHSKTGDGDKSGLICGGIQTIVFKSLLKSDLPIIKSILQSIKLQTSGLLQIDEHHFTFSPELSIEEDLLFSSTNESWIFKENIGIPNRVYIVGGGHVGLAVSRIMATLNFFVTVFDNRSSVSTILENKFADKIIITDYNRINEHIIEGEKSFVVIVTPNHNSDKDALESVLKLNLKYIGSMGSAKKIKSIFAKLKENGFLYTDLEKIHTPIGLAIKAETPEEIAISIASEIIKVKNEIYF